MTWDRCPESAELLALERRPPHDALRRHAEECPRCRNFLLSYREFLEPGAPPPGADPRAAEDRLAGALRPARRTPAAAPREAWWRRLFTAPALRPAWAAVAVLAVAASLLTLRQDTHPDRDARVDGVMGPVLRAPGPASSRLVLGEPRIQSDGTLRLRWSGHPEAEAYVVHVLGPDLAEIARFGPTRDTTLVLGRGQVPSSRGGVVGWRVAAIRGGGEIATSEVDAFVVP